jgi:hypothetical protein
MEYPPRKFDEVAAARGTRPPRVISELSVSDPEVRTALEIGRVQGPRLHHLNFGSLMEIVAQVPLDWIVGGGLVGLLTLGERIFTFPIRVAAKWSEYAAIKAECDLRRTKAEDEMIARKATKIRQIAEHTPSIPLKVAILDPENRDEDLPTTRY